MRAAPLPKIPAPGAIASARERRAAYATTMATLARENPAQSEQITQQTLRALTSRSAQRITRR